MTSLSEGIAPSYLTLEGFSPRSAPDTQVNVKINDIRIEEPQRENLYIW
jgi:hypothetical protein